MNRTINTSTNTLCLFMVGSFDMLPATLLLSSPVVSLVHQDHIQQNSTCKMKPLIVLISTFVIAVVVTYFTQHEANILLSGRIAMSLMLVFTAIGHFKFTNGMAMMLPSFIPAKKQIVLATGVIEILAVIGLFVLPTIKITGILLIVFFALILPANIYAAFKKVNLEKADNSGYGINYLWFRIPEQVFFIAWVYFFSIR